MLTTPSMLREEKLMNDRGGYGRSNIRPAITEMERQHGGSAMMLTESDGSNQQNFAGKISGPRNQVMPGEKGYQGKMMNSTGYQYNIDRPAGHESGSGVSRVQGLCTKSPKPGSDEYYTQQQQLQTAGLSTFEERTIIDNNENNNKRHQWTHDSYLKERHHFQPGGNMQLEDSPNDLKNGVVYRSQEGQARSPTDFHRVRKYIPAPGSREKEVNNNNRSSSDQNLKKQIGYYSIPDPNPFIRNQEDEEKDQQRRYRNKILHPQIYKENDSNALLPSEKLLLEEQQMAAKGYGLTSVQQQQQSETDNDQYQRRMSQQYLKGKGGPGSVTNSLRVSQLGIEHGLSVGQGGHYIDHDAQLHKKGDGMKSILPLSRQEPVYYNPLDREFTSNELRRTIPLDRVKINGKTINLHTYEQLDVLTKSNLLNKIRLFSDDIYTVGFHKVTKNQPRSTEPQELIRWLLAVQSQLLLEYLQRTVEVSTGPQQNLDHVRVLLPKSTATKEMVRNNTLGYRSGSPVDCPELERILQFPPKKTLPYSNNKTNNSSDSFHTQLEKEYGLTLAQEGEVMDLSPKSKLLSSSLQEPLDVCMVMRLLGAPQILVISEYKRPTIRVVQRGELKGQKVGGEEEKAEVDDDNNMNFTSSRGLVKDNSNNLNSKPATWARQEQQYRLMREDDREVDETEKRLADKPGNWMRNPKTANAASAQVIAHGRNYNTIDHLRESDIWDYQKDHQMNSVYEDRAGQFDMEHNSGEHHGKKHDVSQLKQIGGRDHITSLLQHQEGGQQNRNDMTKSQILNLRKLKEAQERYKITHKSEIQFNDYGGNFKYGVENYDDGEDQQTMGRKTMNMATVNSSMRFNNSTTNGTVTSSNNGTNQKLNPHNTNTSLTTKDNYGKSPTNATSLNNNILADVEPDQAQKDAQQWRLSHQRLLNEKKQSMDHSTNGILGGLAPHRKIQGINWNAGMNQKITGTGYNHNLNDKVNNKGQNIPITQNQHSSNEAREMMLQKGSKGGYYNIVGNGNNYKDNNNSMKGKGKGSSYGGFKGGLGDHDVNNESDENIVYIDETTGNYVDGKGNPIEMQISFDPNDKTSVTKISSQNANPLPGRFTPGPRSTANTANANANNANYNFVDRHPGAIDQIPSRRYIDEKFGPQQQGATVNNGVSGVKAVIMSPRQFSRRDQMRREHSG